jgi:hypothetical protein
VFAILSQPEPGIDATVWAGKDEPAADVLPMVRRGSIQTGRRIMDHPQQLFHYHLKRTPDRRIQICEGSGWLSPLFVLAGPRKPDLPVDPITKQEFYALLGELAAQGYMDIRSKIRRPNHSLLIRQQNLSVQVRSVAKPIRMLTNEPCYGPTLDLGG